MAPSLWTSGESGRCCWCHVRDGPRSSLGTGTRCQQAPQLRGYWLLRVRHWDAKCCSFSCTSSKSRKPRRPICTTFTPPQTGRGESSPHPVSGSQVEMLHPLPSLSGGTASVPGHLSAQGCKPDPWATFPCLSSGSTQPAASSCLSQPSPAQPSG